MDCPIIDFVKKYAESNPHRLHMPGHKGANAIGVETLDITEIDGADCLFKANGIIEKSRINASSLFGANTFYSTEGASLAIRAMLYLAIKHAKENGLNEKIVAGRNAHKSFLSACAVMNIEVDWLYANNCDSYLSCPITEHSFNEYLKSTKEPPCALYITSPDYLGNITKIEKLSKLCKEKDILLLVDNAHGAYTKFLENSLHPIDFGADMCTDSAHKTLPCLTGGAYLHINKDEKLKDLCLCANDALALFGSTSPSYLILQSLDYVNIYLASVGKTEIKTAAEKTEVLKIKLQKAQYSLIGDEPLKITIDAKAYGYTGFELNEHLKSNGIISEFYDQDYLVLMVSPKTTDEDYLALEKALLSLKQKNTITKKPPKLLPKKSVISFNNAIFSSSENVNVDNALGRISSGISVSCPPAVPIVVCGEVIDENAIENFKYYGIKKCNVIK